MNLADFCNCAITGGTIRLDSERALFSGESFSKNLWYNHLMGSGKGKARRLQNKAVASDLSQDPIIRSDGRKEWRVGSVLSGDLHRVDGPAVEYQDGSEEWFLNGKHHREGGPAISYMDGTKVWRRHGELHRVGGPAMTYSDGKKTWWVDGERHREDGPAIINADGT